MEKQGSNLIIPGASNAQGKAPYYQRKIKCPAHYLIPPSIDVFKRVPVAELKYVSKSVVQHYKIKKYRRATDMFGRPIIDWKKLHELERKGLVKQPWVTASFAIENIYDPKSPICLICQKRCHEGKERVVETTIKRLNRSR